MSKAECGERDGPPAPLFTFQVRRVGWILGLGAVFFALTGLTTAMFRLAHPHMHVYGVLNLFDLNSDSSVPTWFSSLGLAVCAGLLLAIARLESIEKSSLTGRWRLLSFIFLVLSVDETARIHETLGAALGAQVVQTVGQLGGIFYFSWIPFGIGVVIVLGLYYLPFFLKLPPGLRYRIILAAVVYVGGALVTETFNAVTEFSEGSPFNARYQYFTVFEEFCEMIGVALFAHFLAAHIGSRVRGANLLLCLATGPRAVPVLRSESPDSDPRNGAHR